MSAFAASSGVAKLRWSSGAVGDAASAHPNQRVAARIDTARHPGIAIGNLLPPPATSTATTSAATMSTATAGAATCE